MNNAYEFSIKVKAQIEQVDLGVGDKLGTILQYIAQLFTGLIIPFINSMKLTLYAFCFSLCCLLFNHCFEN